MLEEINNIDTDLFLFLNGLNTDFWDPIMFFISGKFFIGGFYLIIITILFVKLGWQRGLFVILFLGLTVLLCDKISVLGFKEVFERLRPSHEPNLNGLVHLVNNYRGGQHGFVSSHAANSFGLSTFFWLVLKGRVNRIGWILFLGAILISYSRIYLGVHYPLDIICGGILGATLAFICYNIYLLGVKKVFI